MERIAINNKDTSLLSAKPIFSPRTLIYKSQSLNRYWLIVIVMRSTILAEGSLPSLGFSKDQFHPELVDGLLPVEKQLFLYCFSVFWVR